VCQAQLSAKTCQGRGCFQDSQGILQLSDAANATPTALAVKTKPQIKVERHPGALEKGRRGSKKGMSSRVSAIALQVQCQFVHKGIIRIYVKCWRCLSFANIFTDDYTCLK